MVLFGFASSTSEAFCSFLRVVWAKLNTHPGGSCCAVSLMTLLPHCFLSYGPANTEECLDLGEKKKNYFCVL